MRTVSLTKHRVDDETSKVLGVRPSNQRALRVDGTGLTTRRALVVELSTTATMIMLCRIPHFAKCTVVVLVRSKDTSTTTIVWCVSFRADENSRRLHDLLVFMFRAAALSVFIGYIEVVIMSES